MTSCLSCGLKHVSYAEVLLTESRMGYPRHFWRAVGQLVAAEDELLGDFPDLAHMVREERLRLMEDPYGEYDTVPRVHVLIDWLARRYERETGTKLPTDRKFVEK